MKSILVPTEQHALLPSILQSALLLSQEGSHWSEADAGGDERDAPQPSNSATQAVPGGKLTLQRGQELSWNVLAHGDLTLPSWRTPTVQECCQVFKKLTP